jgi:cob(I)alamin adenosyltransferase
MRIKIYTKRGDNGTTMLFGGERLPKDAVRIEAYGTVDELNSVIGIVRGLGASKELDAILYSIQNALFTLGADLATPQTKVLQKIPRVGRQDITAMEKIIDRFEQELPPLTSFILPGGSIVASYLHFARTVCRRAERLSVRLARSEKMSRYPVIFLNRLSDLLFVLARYANRIDKNEEIKWMNPVLKRKKG